MSKKTNRLFEMFAGEYVIMLSHLFVERTTSNGEIIETIKTPISFQGFLIEADDVYYYLGLSPDLINQSVKIEDVSHIEITKEHQDIMEELLENEEIPSEDKFN